MENKTLEAPSAGKERISEVILQMKMENVTIP